MRANTQQDGPSLLPDEPRVMNWVSTQELTERFLIPSVTSLEALFLGIRGLLDPILSATQPIKLGKPYPLGQCLEISLAVMDALQKLDPSSLAGSALDGYNALRAFLRHGGTFRRVWGDLRGEYFQNAFLAGTLYIDVSNDTVVPTKPKVEVLPLDQTRFTPIKDYLHFSRIASRYWKAQIFPNHIAPSLAPYAPYVVAIPNGGVAFHSATNYMFHLTLSGKFEPSEAALDSPAMRPDLFRRLSSELEGSLFERATDPEQGKALALQNCREYRAEGRHRSAEHARAAIEQLTEANKRLARLKVRVVESTA